MKTLQSIIEDSEGNVIGCSTDSGDVMLDQSDVVPRAGLASVALTLAEKYGVRLDDSMYELVSHCLISY